jgi:hypothetical protein
MANELIKPIDENTAKAIEESAKSIGKGIDLVGGLGSYLSRALGGVPENLIGLLVGDWLIHKRARRWGELQAETLRILEQRKVQEPYEDISPSIALPLIEAALDEVREVLKDIWANLLASAMDPKRKDFVRRNVIDAVRAMEPIDALVFSKIPVVSTNQDTNTVDKLVSLLGLSNDEIVVATRALHQLGVIEAHNISWRMSPFGNIVTRAIYG